VVARIPDSRSRSSQVAVCGAKSRATAGGDVEPVRRAAGHHEVDVVAAQHRPHHAARPDLQADRDARMLVAERGQQVRHQALARRGHGAEPDRAVFGIRLPARRPQRLVVQAEDAPGILGIPLAGGGQSHATAGAVDQRHADLGRERTDRRRDRRLRDHQLLGRRAHRSGVGQRDEGAQPRVGGHACSPSTGTTAVIVVPPPGVEVTCSVPPTTSARSDIDRMP
jgi:hypothetical protein